MSNSLTINTPNIVQQNTPLRNVPSGSTATPDYSVKYVPQDLTEAQQAQARQNIGAAAAGEGGGATINEFHYLRDTTTDPTTYYIDADGYEPKEGDLITIVWDWPFRTNENDPDAAFKNPATLKNNSTNPSIYIKNAHQMATDYDEIDPEVNTRWTVRLEKVDNTWYAYNISTAVQADWNTSDSTMPSYIKNKPTIPGAQVQSDWNQSDNTAVDYIKNKPTIPADTIQTHAVSYVFLTSTSPEARVNRKTDHNAKTYKDGVLVTSGNTVLIGSRYQGAYYGVDVVYDNQVIHYQLNLTNLTDNSVTYIERNCDQNLVWLHAKVPSNFAGKLIVRLHNRNYNKIPWATGFEGPMDADITTFYDYYTWTSYQTDNKNKYVGKIVFPNVPLPANTDTMDTVPDLQYCTGIYIHRSKVDAWKTWIAGLYVANTDLTPIYNKIVPYDFVAWYNYFSVEIVSLPTVPLTMTDENSTVISGDFVAQNVTITPANSN